MNKTYFEGQRYQGNDVTALEMGEYDDCSFSNCVFSNADLSGRIFTDCRFENCDLSNAVLKGTAFRNVRFAQSKLLGLRFDECNGFSLSFDFSGCLLNFSSFYKLKLPKTRFLDCKLVEVDFVESDLGLAVFKDCDLAGAVFENTKLEGADFRSAVNFSIDPTTNRLKKAKFSTQNIAGLLDKFQIIVE